MRSIKTILVVILLLWLGGHTGQAVGTGRYRPEAYRASIKTAAYGAVVQPDGKIIAAGTAGNHFALVRFNPDGSLDTDFDSDGKVDTSFGAVAVGHGVALQSDGKIVVAGTAGDDFALARYHPDGSLDTSLDSDGIVTTTFGTAAQGSSVAIQTDGMIVIAGTAGDGFAAARYLPDGSLDPLFGASGKVIASFAEDARGAGVVFQSAGQIVVGGTAGDYFALARYLPDGSPDTAFGAGGQLVTPFNVASIMGVSMALQPNDDKIVALGSTGWFYGATFALARFNPDGSLDASFGDGGRVYPSISQEYAFGSAVAVQPDGKILAGGANGIFCQCDFPPLDFTFIRLNPDGSHDIGSTIEVTTANEQVYAIALQTDGKIILAGPAGDSFYGSREPDFFALVRVDSSGSLDTTFSEDGKTLVDFSIVTPYYLPWVGR